MPDQPTRIDLPVTNPDPDGHVAKVRGAIFKAIIESAIPHGGGGVIDTQAAAEACLDTIAHLVALGDAARSPTAARKFGEQQGKAIRQRMLRFRRDIEAGTVASPFMSPPALPAKH